VKDFEITHKDLERMSFENIIKLRKRLDKSVRFLSKHIDATKPNERKNINKIMHAQSALAIIEHFFQTRGM